MEQFIVWITLGGGTGDKWFEINIFLYVLAALMHIVCQDKNDLV